MRVCVCVRVSTLPSLCLSLSPDVGGGRTAADGRHSPSDTDRKREIEAEAAKKGEGEDK